jgi:hypothetical protein
VEVRANVQLQVRSEAAALVLVSGSDGEIVGSPPLVLRGRKVDRGSLKERDLPGGGTKSEMSSQRG